MAEPKPLLDKFGIHLRLQGCVMSTLEYNLNMGPDNFKNLKKIGAQIIFEAVFRYGEEFFLKSEFLIVTCHLYIVFCVWNTLTFLGFDMNHPDKK